MGDYLALALLAVLGLLLVSAGIEDARVREIANWKNAAIALLAPLWWWSLGLRAWPDMALQLGVAALVFGFFAGTFYLRQMGGGDVKLIGALALWLPLPPLISTLVVMTLLGGALTLVMVAEQWVVRRQGVPRISGPVALLGVALLAGAVTLPSGDALTRLQSQPLVWLAVVIASLGVIGLALLSVVRAARERGIAPETPYGVAIAIAGLLSLREPIINQFR